MISVVRGGVAAYELLVDIAHGPAEEEVLLKLK